MNYLRKHPIIKSLSIILTVLILNLNFSSCGENENLFGFGFRNNDNPPEIPISQFHGNALEIETDDLGRINMGAEIYSQGQDYNLTYEFQIKDQSGNPVEGITITYSQLNEKSIIYIHDELGRYASTFFIGTPHELETYFAGSSSKSGPYASPMVPSDNNNYKESEALITLTIIALITLASITIAEVGFILDAYEVQKFYLTDYVTETEDYILYCKTFGEIAELIKARTSMVLNLKSIFVSYISLGAPVSSLAVELTKSITDATREMIAEELLNQAITAWGVAMDDIAERKVAVKVFPYEEDQSFSGARNLFATYTIEYDNEICYGDGIISGTVTDAETGNAINNVTVKLSGDDNTTDLTNNQGEYSFEALNEGDYTITVEKNNYITEHKDINFDGSSAVVNFVISKTIANNEYRVVLTWGEEPLDMDIHLFTENGDHIYYNNKGSLTSYPFIYLDIDDLNSFGPETITITELQTSSIYVNNYSQNPSIKESNAHIKLYQGSSLIRQYNIPSSGTGLWWYVFDINSNGIITEQNYLTDYKIQLELKN